MARYRYRTKNEVKSQKSSTDNSHRFSLQGDAGMFLFILIAAYLTIPILFSLRAFSGVVNPYKYYWGPVLTWGNLIFYLGLFVLAVDIIVNFLKQYRNLIFLIYSYLILLLCSLFFAINSDLFEFFIILTVAIASLVLYYRSYQLTYLFPKHITGVKLGQGILVGFLVVLALTMIVVKILTI